MAGVPKIMQAMVENILPTLKGGEQLPVSPFRRRCRRPNRAAMGALQAEYEDVNWGSIRFTGLRGGVSVVARARDQARLEAVEGRVIAYLTRLALSGWLAPKSNMSKHYQMLIWAKRGFAPLWGTC